MISNKTFKTTDGLFIRQLTVGKWEVRDGAGKWIADGRTKKSARARARLLLSTASSI